VHPPDQILFADGTSRTLEGIYFPQSAALTKQAEELGTFWQNLGEHGQDVTVSVSFNSEGTRGECLRRVDYWCGNTFFPSFFPRRLPRHEPSDFAELLVLSGLALPASEAVDDLKYRETLLDAFDRAVEFSSYPLHGRVRRGDKVAVELGRSLVTRESRRFVAGAYLLIAAQDVETYPQLEHEIRRRIQRNRDDYDAIAQTGSSHLDALLAWINADEARGRALSTPVQTDSLSGGYLWSVNASILASHGDLAAFDSAARMLNSDTTPPAIRDSLITHVPRRFRWPPGARGFQQWYLGARSTLRSGRDDFGKLAFWLEEGTPFDSRYFESMNSVINGR
jgi:hypothetical protein